MSTESLTFQDAVARLQAYWADCGCLVWQPNNVEVGAGTMNPATFLHVLGPEPWNVAYVEPSIRPDDARYGENPNRMGRHHQFQVILKPDPGDPQQLYLDSLAALGIDLKRHDIRFVEDNWESPALGAWGLGWEVWLDGLEITQFTYFQQAGSLDLEPVSIEITYGLDRILMALQDVTHFKDLAWNERVKFGDVLMANEVQTSRYYFEQADVGRLTQLYDLYEAEAMDALRAGLVRPGHDYVLKCSHVFNILDARGAIGVTERARYFGRMRRLARQVAEGYVAEREAAEYPLLDADGAAPWVAGAGSARVVAEAPPDLLAPAPPSEPAPFLLEVGVEELPVADLDAALAALAERVPALLAEARLAHGAVTVLGTPRRLVLLVDGLAPGQADHASQVVGPPVRAAYDAAGKPTPAAEGFARSAGVSLAALTRVTQKGEERIAAVKQEAGRSAATILAERLPSLLGALPFARSMRWNASGQAFSRPVRWLVALHGSHVLPLSFAGLAATAVTVSSRPQGSRPLPLAAAEDYLKLMRSLNLAVDPELRRAEVARQVQAVAKQAGGSVADDPALVGEVANLVEQPNALLGAFDAAYLALPEAVLVTVMKKHQRYFAVRGPDGALLPHFIAVANGGALDAAAVRHGNEAVLAARFADAAYFWRQDAAKKLDDFTPALAGLAFQADLGSMLDKVRRLEQLAPKLGTRLGLSKAEIETTRRAAALSKSDLTASMVVDFTSLQGVMGREYARLGGESDAVAEALYEQYLPRGAGDDLPATAAGTVLALADRLDSLVGLFAVGLRPTGAQDPYGLRRAAGGLATILTGRGLDLDLVAALGDAAAGLPLPVGRATGDEVLEFIAKRLEGQLREAGHAADAVAAVLALQGRNPYRAAQTVATLEQHIARPDWGATLTAYARCARLLRAQATAPGAVDPAQFEVPAERVLHEATAAVTESLDRSDPNAVLHALAALAPAVNTFFDEVLVMAEDAAVRANRLALVAVVAGLAAGVGDLSLLEGF